MGGRGARQLAAAAAAKVVCDKEKLQSHISSPPLCLNLPPAAGRRSAAPTADYQRQKLPGDTLP